MIIPGVVAAYRANYLVPAACDAYWDDVVLAMHMDGTDGSDVFVDEKGHTPTVYGPSSISSTHKFGGGSGYFDGSAFGSVNYYDSDDFKITGDFTIDCWIQLDTSLTTTDCVLVSLHYPGSLSSLFALKATVGATPDSYSVGCLTCVAAPQSYSTFTHILLSREGGTTRLFINGVLSATSVLPIGLPVDTTMVSIGSFRSTSSGSGYTKGYIDDLRITKGVARYTDDFPVPTAPFYEVQCGPDPTGGSAVVVPGPGVPCEPNFAKMVLALHMNGADGTNTFTDETGKTASLVNTPLIKTNNSKFGGASAYFDGKSAVVFGASADFALTKDFTVSFWLSPTYYGTQILGTGSAGAGFYLFSQLAFAGELTLYHGGAYRTTSGAAVPQGAWTHIEISRSGTSINLFVNGVSRLQYDSILPFGNASANVVIGSHYTNSATPASLFYGNIDDLFIMDGHAQHTANFAVPVDPFGAACP